jgi:hypothetical protein
VARRATREFADAPDDVRRRVRWLQIGAREALEA